MKKMEEVIEETKKEVEEAKILIIVIEAAIFGIIFFGTSEALVLVDRILVSFISVLVAVVIEIAYIASYSFAYISGKRAEIEREKELKMEREKLKMS